jgi:undecaprenyl-phosphate galactose phosphotransferase
MFKRFLFSSLVYIVILIGIDLFALYGSLQAAFYVRTNYLSEYLAPAQDLNIEKYFWVLIVVMSFLIIEKIYTNRYDFWSDTKRTLKALFFAFVAVLSVVYFAKMSENYSRGFLILFFLFAALFLPIFKRIAKRLLFTLNIFKIKVKIVAHSVQQKDLERELEENWYFGFSVCDKRYDMVLVASKGFPIEKLQYLIKKYSKRTKDIYVVPYMYHLDFSHADVLDFFNIRLSAIHIENKLLSLPNVFLKTLSEKFLVLLVFPFALLLHVILVVLIRSESKGNAIFKQKRFGKNGKVFSCYKYRTMYQNGDEILREYLRNNPDETTYYEIYHKYQNDPRVTKLGKILRASSLDELPQFYNILRGDMNLIGPRPYMLSEREKIGLYNEDIILKVKPGITGLWQVLGRNNLSFQERIELDKWYIQNWSLWIDFVIFMKTIKVVLSKVGAR